MARNAFGDREINREEEICMDMLDRFAETLGEEEKEALTHVREFV